jgi:hypothetical protein
MRSGSSLLAHILANHPDVVGSGETHISYQMPADLPKLIIRTSEFLHRPVLHETYIVDQINHNYVADEVLLSRQIYKSIILIREPAAALKSTMHLLKCQEHQALEVYKKRLDELTHYGLLLKERALLVEYDDLVDCTEQALDAITRFLGLGSPLTPTYTTHRMTGRVKGYGDPSNNIKTGHIIRTRGHEIAISQDTLVAATDAFRRCREELHTAEVQSLNRVVLPRIRDSLPVNE